MLKVLKTGFFTTLQDGGRFGFRDKGVPVSGCMDLMAYEQCNQLLENPQNAAILEITMQGPILEFAEPTFIVLTGANMSPLLNGTKIENHAIIKIQGGDVLEFGKLVSGFRCYLGIKDGFVADSILGSTSQFVPLTKASHLVQNEEVGYHPRLEFSPKISGMKPNNYFKETTLEVLKGPEFDLLKEKEIDLLLEQDFHIAKENNRMAYQLVETIASHSNSILTSATLPGTVQWTPAGKLIVLMRDGQTTGGYPRILQLRNEAISVLAQKKTNDKINFKLFYK